MSLSLSSLGHAAVCPGSAVLDGAEGVAGNPGSALHEYVSILLRQGRREANDALDQIVARWSLGETDASIVRWRAQRFEPDVPDGALSEVALCLLDDGSVVEVEGARGQYKMPPNGVIAGTVDLMWSEPEPLYKDADGRWRAPAGAQLWAVDLKTGSDAHVAAIGRNWQVRGSALLAARWLGLPSRGVVGALCYLPRSKADDPRGRWEKIGEAWGENDLAAFETEIRGIVARVRESEALAAAGRIPELIMGPHCGFCKARVVCPAFAIEARAMMRQGGDGKIRLPVVGELSRDDLGRMASTLIILERAARGVRDLLKAEVERGGPIALPDGRVYGPEDCGEVERFATRELYQAVVDEIADILPVTEDDAATGARGADKRARAAALVDDAFRAPWDKIEECVRRAMDEAGEARGLGRHIGRIKEAVREAGGVRREPMIKWRPHHPGKTAGIIAASEMVRRGEDGES